MTSKTNYSHWYELNPSRLEMEKLAMSTLFPDFELSTDAGGQLRYSGTLMSEQFNRKQGYSVNVDFYNGGTENFGNPGIIITPVSPDFKELFPDSKYDELQQLLLNQVAIDMKCVCYEDPAIYETPTIITAASLLKRTIEWFLQYEAEKEKNTFSSAAAQSERLRQLLSHGVAMRMKMESETDKPEDGPKLPPYEDRWYDTYPGLYEIRLAYLHQFFPQFVSEIKPGSLTGLITGNIINLSGILSIGLATNPNTGKHILYKLRVYLEGYRARLHLDIEQEDISYIQNVLGYVPEFIKGEDLFNEYPSSMSTLLDIVLNVYEWLSAIEYGLLEKLHSCYFFRNNNVPIGCSRSPDDPSQCHNPNTGLLLNEDSYLYQSPPARKRRELRGETYSPDRIIKLK